MSDIDTSLIPDFVAEAVEHLEEMESGLLKIEADPTNVELLNGIFRNIHTIKGAAQFIGLKQTSVLSHNAENLLDLLRNGERSCTHSMVDILIQVKDRLGQLLREVESTQDEQTLVDDLVAAIVNHIEGTDASVTALPTVAASTKASTSPELADQTSEPIPADWQVQAEATSAFASKNINKEFENYDEELDQELFSIFFSQLADEMTNLSALTERAMTADIPGPLLLDCVTSLEKLKSSANYMGYEHLIDLYDAWIRTLYSFLGIDNPEWAAIDGYFEKIIQRFPKLGPVLLGNKASVVSEPRPEPKAAVLKAIVSKTPTPKTTPTTSGAVPQPQSVAATSVAPATDDLLAQLNAALKLQSTAPVPIASNLDSVAFEELTDVIDDDSDAMFATASATDFVEESASKITDTAPINKATLTRNSQEGIEDSQKAAPNAEKTLKRSVRVDADKIDTLMNQVGELIVHRSYFNQIHNELTNIQRKLESAGIDSHQAKALRTLSYRYSEAIVSLSRTANELQEGVMKVRMLPIAQLFNRYPRLVHDLVRHSDKKVRLEMRGEDTELDKMIIEEVSDPLIHIIRNAIDHGFETAAERKISGKPETGTLVLDAYHESNHIVIKVTDDGRGIDPRKVGAKAVEKGLITEAELERMSPREITRLIMQAGFSTAEAITNTSGRGVGMDVVRKNIEKLNGSVEIDSDVGYGTRFRLKIPLTLAIISALQVRVGDTHFTVPLANVEETLRVFEKDTSVIEGIEVIQLRGHTMPIFRLSNLFGIGGDDRTSRRFFVVVVNTGNEKVGLVVDELLGQDEVVIKPLIDFLQEKSGFSGATIIGGGRISLILDVYELVKMTAYKQARIQHQFAIRRRQQMQQSHALQ